MSDSTKIVQAYQLVQAYIHGEESIFGTHKVEPEQAWRVASKFDVVDEVVELLQQYIDEVGQVNEGYVRAVNLHTVMTGVPRLLNGVFIAYAEAALNLVKEKFSENLEYSQPTLWTSDHGWVSAYSNWENTEVMPGWHIAWEEGPDEWVYDFSFSDEIVAKLDGMGLYAEVSCSWGLLALERN